MSGSRCLQTARHVRSLLSPHPHTPQHTTTISMSKFCTANTSPGTLGISTYAAKALGDVVYIELPQIEMDVSEGDAIGAVESVKSASDILTPVSGTVAEVNNELQSKPGNINKDPEGEAWIAKITISGEPAGKMMSKEEYAAFTEE
jgi:glycine cleavage system H protein